MTGWQAGRLGGSTFSCVMIFLLSSQVPDNVGRLIVCLVQPGPAWSLPRMNQIETGQAQSEKLRLQACPSQDIRQQSQYLSISVSDTNKIGAQTVLDWAIGEL